MTSNLDINLQRLSDARDDIADAITAKGGTVSSLDGFEDFVSDIATITNQYTSQDEGKVVSNGSLVTQTSITKTINGTYDTTYNNSITIDVPSLPSGVEMAKLTPVSSTITECDMYLINCCGKTYLVGYLTSSYTSASSLTLSYPSTFTPNCTNCGGNYDNLAVIYTDGLNGTYSRSINAYASDIRIYADYNQISIKNSTTYKGNPLCTMFTTN